MVSARAGIEPLELQRWLEWAGAKFIALPCGRLRPAQPTVIWPEYAQDRHEVLEFRGRPNLGLHAAAPSAAEIPLMDEILLLPNLCPDIRARRAVRLRTLVHPISRRYLNPWPRTAEILHTNPQSARIFFNRGLRTILDRAPCGVLANLVVKMDDYI